MRSEVDSAAPVALPSFHCYGQTDRIIGMEESLAASALFDPQFQMCVEHAGGHLVPSAREVRKQFKVFLQTQSGQSA